MPKRIALLWLRSHRIWNGSTFTFGIEAQNLVRWFEPSLGFICLSGCPLRVDVLHCCSHMLAVTLPSSRTWLNICPTASIRYFTLSVQDKSDVVGMICDVHLSQACRSDDRIIFFRGCIPRSHLSYVGNMIHNTFPFLGGVRSQVLLVLNFVKSPA